MSNRDHHQFTNNDNSNRQVLAALAINSSSFLQGASISTSSIILHQLQQQNVSYSDTVYQYNSTKFVEIDNATTISKELITNSNLFENFRVSEETGSWIGTKYVPISDFDCFIFLQPVAGSLDICSLPVLLDS